MKILTLLLAILRCSLAMSQSVTITPGSSATTPAIGINSTTQGLVLSRMTSPQRKALTSSAIVGTLVFDTDKGAVYLFDGVNWSPLTTTDEKSLFGKKYFSNPAVQQSLFGYIVDIDGDYAVIDHYYQNKVYVYKKGISSWVLQATLNSPYPQQYDYFGSSVSISGDYIVVGASGYNIIASGSAQGCAYVFMRNGVNWNFQTQLIASGFSTDDHFGNSVDIEGSSIIVGAKDDETNVYNSGEAYIFNRNGTVWNEVTRLEASDPSQSAYFGNSVSISGNYVIIGAYQANGNANNEGAAYIFYNNWSNYQIKILRQKSFPNILV